jgi:hypothetical protein
MLQAPFDKLLVEIKAKYEDEIQFASGVKLYVDPSFNPNFHATSEGIVHSVPRSLRHANAGIDAIIKPGDVVLFSYKTVGDISFDDNTHLFRMTTKEEGYVTEWMNQDRHTIRMEKGFKERQWAVVYTDQYGRLLAGKVGDAGECENWIATNFKFASGEGFTYDNQLYYEGKEMWRVDYPFVFAIRRDGHMRMVGDYLLVEPVVENRPLKILHTNLERTEADRYCVREDKGWLRCGECGREGMKNGDLLVFEPNLKEKYNVGGKPMYIVKKQFVMGKEESLAGIETLGLN